MSTTTVSFHATAQDVKLEELRWAEEAAREAARLAAAREAEKRRIEESIRQRMHAANRLIASTEARYRALLLRLDEAAGRLPDLILAAPQLPHLDSETAGDLLPLEAYAHGLTSQVNAFERRLDEGIAAAEHRLRRRLAKAAAWREIVDLQAQLDLRHRANLDIATGLNERLDAAGLPPPAADAELEAVETHVGALRRALDAAATTNRALKARQAAQRRAADLAGTARDAGNAEDRVQRFEAAVLDAVRRRIEDRIAAALDRTGQQLADLSDATRMLIEGALTNAGGPDQGERVTRLILSEKERRDGIARALSFITRPPDLSQGDPALIRRWTNLLGQFQRVAGGLDAFSPSLEREHQDIAAAADRQRNAAFSKASWIRAMAEQGFEVVQRDDGDGLILVDLDNPDIWLEATEVAPKDGTTDGFGAVLEMRTDGASAASHEVAATDICARLARVAAPRPNITSVAEVVERDSRVPRARRPTKARHAFIQGT